MRLLRVLEVKDGFLGTEQVSVERPLLSLSLLRKQLLHAGKLLGKPWVENV